MKKNDKPTTARTVRQEDLLEVIRQKIGAEYISDLRYQPFRALAIQAAAGEKAEDYTLWVWNDALEYVLSHIACATAEEARRVFAAAANSCRRGVLKK